MANIKKSFQARSTIACSAFCGFDKKCDGFFFEASNKKCKTFAVNKLVQTAKATAPEVGGHYYLKTPSERDLYSILILSVYGEVGILKKHGYLCKNQPVIKQLPNNLTNNALVVYEGHLVYSITGRLFPSMNTYS